MYFCIMNGKMIQFKILLVKYTPKILCRVHPAPKGHGPF